MTFCSSVKVECNCDAIYDARPEDGELAVGIEFGGYTISRIGECGFSDDDGALFQSPGVSRMVRAMFVSCFVVVWFVSSCANCNRRW